MKREVIHVENFRKGVVHGMNVAHLYLVNKAQAMFMAEDNPKTALAIKECSKKFQELKTQAADGRYEDVEQEWKNHLDVQDQKRFLLYERSLIYKIRRKNKKKKNG